MVCAVRRARDLPLALVALSIALVAIATDVNARQQPRSAGPAPLAIASAALTQDGRQLSWRVELQRPFSAIGLQRSGRSLCLALERVRSHAIVGELCVEPRRGGGIALVYTREPGTGAPASHAIVAPVSRSNPEELTATFLPPAVGIGYRTLRWQVLSELARTSCRSAAATGGGCPPLLAVFTGLARLHTPELVGCVPAGSSLVFDGSPNAHKLALTFDDGPWPDPPTIDFVHLLARYHVPATFFEIGQQIRKYDPTGAVQRAMRADGDMVGDHTWTHPDMDSLSPVQQTSELEQTAAAIRQATGGVASGFTPCLWRPPYGDTDPRLEGLARSLGFLTIMWSVDPQDWALPGTGAIYENVVGNVRNGSIVIQHFGGGPRYETLAALPQEIKTLRARGYQFVTVAQQSAQPQLFRE